MRSLILGLFLLHTFCLAALAKPMPTPSLAEGVATSPVIVVAKYQSFRPGKVDYFAGVKATYRITQVLKGAASPKDPLTVDYLFYDGSACLEPEGWTFNTATMPKVGSQWILLLQPPGTYRGDFGRLPATPENISKVKALLGANPAR